MQHVGFSFFFLFLFLRLWTTFKYSARDWQKLELPLKESIDELRCLGDSITEAEALPRQGWPELDPR